jgi:hypothetical protein
LEYKYKGACYILKEHGEEPISMHKLKNMKSELEELMKDRAEEIEAIKKKERESAEMSKNMAIRNQDLSHKAETAELNATVNQQKKEIQTLQNTIDNLRSELAEQRKLTKEVAEAGRQAPITVTSNK